MTDSTTKRCTKCGQGKPATTKYFRPGKRNKNGLRPTCRECDNAYERDRSKNPEKYKRILIRTDVRVCSRCKRELPATSEFFTTNNTEPLGIAYRCRECDRDYKKSWVAQKLEANPDFRHQNHLKRREQHAEKCREYYQRNREHLINKAAEYARTHRAQTNHNKNKNIHKRRAINQTVPVSFSTSDWKRCLSYFNHRCAACGRPRGLWHTLAREHWIAVTSPDYPGHIVENIIPLCHGLNGCNNTKSNRDSIEWLNNRFGEKEAKRILKRIQDYFQWIKDIH
jgi:hypothetical protein